MQQIRGKKIKSDKHGKLCFHATIISVVILGDEVSQLRGKLQSSSCYKVSHQQELFHFHEKDGEQDELREPSVG